MVAISQAHRPAAPVAQATKPVARRAPGLAMFEADRVEHRPKNSFASNGLRKPRWAGGKAPWEDAASRSQALADALDQGQPRRETPQGQDQIPGLDAP
jgi:hypothetical protein